MRRARSFVALVSSVVLEAGARGAAVLAVLTVLSGSARAQACTTEWAAPTSGAFDEAANWTNGVPGEDDVACITAAGTYTVTADAAQIRVAGFLLGGASGTQTLTSTADFDVSGDATIAPGGVFVTNSRGSSNADGLDVAGTLLVEGVVAHGAFTRLMNVGGTLDVAPGGVLRYVEEQARAGSSDGLIRLRGTIEVDCSSSRCYLDAPVEARGGTIRVTAGDFYVEWGGTITALDLDVDAGASLSLLGWRSPWVIEGTVSGEPQGNVYWSAGRVEAGPAGATLALGGTGAQLIGSVSLASAGGAFTNTGLLYRPRGFSSNFAGISGVEVVNRGRIEIRDGLALREDALITNAPEGVIAFVGDGSKSVGSSGEIVNQGAIVVEADVTSASSISVSVATEEGALRVEAPVRLQLNEGGALRDATIAVVEGGALWTRKTFEVEGALAGTIAGSYDAFQGEYLAGPAGAELNVTGNGLNVGAGSGTLFRFGSTGGSFINRGRINALPNGPRIGPVIFRNEGLFRVDRAMVTLESGAVLRNAAVGRVEMIQGGQMGGEGRFENAGLAIALRSQPTGFARSSFGGTLRSLSGSELRTTRGARLTLDAPASRALPADVRLTGDGEAILSQAFEIEGTVSPGTDAVPIDTLDVSSWLIFSRFTGSPRYVVDVDAGGVSDQIALTRGSGPSFAARLAGTLVVRPRPGYTPQVGDTFAVIRVTNSTDQFQGRFTQVVAEGAPEGIAFVAEPDEDSATLLLRAVEAASDGPVTVSSTAPVGGGVRSLFLSGPGVPGVTAAQLACTSCLDDEAFGVIDGELTGTGTLKEARFDLTSPRVFGFYDLVLQRPGLDDLRVPITVRPYLSYISFNPGVDRGAGIRPAGVAYNWSAFSVSNVSNDPAPAFTIAAVNREAETQVDFALAAANAFSGAVVYYESIDAEDPEAAALVYGRIESGGDLPLSYGQRIDPSEVLFPEQTRTGPDDDRIAFGETQVFSGLAVQHLSFDRIRAILVEALMETDDAVLAAYLADVEAAEAGALERAAGDALVPRRTYVDGLGRLFGMVLDELDDVVATPAGLEEAAFDAFVAAVNLASGNLLVDIYQAYEVDLASAPEDVRTLLVGEFEALGGYGAAAGKQGQEQASPTCSVPPGTSTGDGASGVGDAASEASQRGAASIALAASALLPKENQTATAAHEVVHSVQQTCRNLSNAISNVGGSLRIEGGGGIASSRAAACTFPPAPPGGPSGGGGYGCGGPSGPADPNDKTALTPQFRCEPGIVIVDGEEVSRCVRYFVPLAEARTPFVYTIDFENLPEATANAAFITITDTLDAALDPSSLRVLSTSSDSTFSYEVSGQIVTFRFVGIELPPNRNAPEGQGFVTFAVRPRAGLEPGTEIRNDASIVFDYNPPIATPEVVHELRETADLTTRVFGPDVVTEGEPFIFNVAVAHLRGDPASEVVVTIQTGTPARSATPTVGECTGTDPITCTLGTLADGAEESIEVVLDAPPVGVYTLSSSVTSAAFDAFTANDRDVVESGVAGVGTEDEMPGVPGSFVLDAVYPNPLADKATMRYGMPVGGPVTLAVYDVLGRRVAVLEEGVRSAGWHHVVWNATPVANGVYFCQLRAGGATQIRPVLVVR